jgi:hypothetical protein
MTEVKLKSHNFWRAVVCFHMRTDTTLLVYNRCFISCSTRYSISLYTWSAASSVDSLIKRASYCHALIILYKTQKSKSRGVQERLVGEIAPLLPVHVPGNASRREFWRSFESNVESAGPPQKNARTRGDSKGTTASFVCIVYFEIQPPLIRPFFCGHTLCSLSSPGACEAVCYKLYSAWI